MKNFVCVVAAVLMASAVALALRNAGNKVGVKVTIGENALNYFKDELLPMAEKAILSAEIPDLTETVSVPVVGKVEMGITNIKLNRLNIKNSSIDFNSGNTIAVSLSGFETDLSLQWHYREANWPHVSDSGTGEGTTTRSHGVVATVVGTDSDGRPTAKFGQCSLDFTDLEITIHGGASWLYNVVINVFRAKIISVMQSAVCAALHTKLQDVLDETLEHIPVQVPLGPKLAIDYSLTTNNGLFVTPDKQLVASSAGEFYPRNGEPGKAPGTPVQMPNSISNKEFQIFISSYSAETLGYAAVTSGMCEKTLNKADAPSLVQTLFTTDFYGGCAPGLVKKYGRGKDIQMFFDLHGQPSIEFSKDKNVLVNAGLEMTIRGQGEKGWEDAFTLLLKVTANAVVKVNDTTISGEIRKADASASLVSSHVGNVEVSGIDTIISFAISLSMAAVNEVLATGVPLPAMSGISLKNPSIVYNDGYIAIISDVNITLPTRHW